jgi:hypothetical protein
VKVSLKKTLCNVDSWDLEYIEVDGERKGHIWNRKPKVSVCLELVRTGDLDIQGARDTFDAWGLVDDELVEKTLTFVGRLANASREEQDRELAISLMKELRLNFPEEEFNTTFDWDKFEEIMWNFVPENVTEQIEDDDRLGLEELLKLITLFNRSKELQMNDDVKDMLEAIELFFRYDPAAAVEILAPLLEAIRDSNQTQNALHGSSETDSVRLENSSLLNAEQVEGDDEE